jgi:NAD(P)-dependent dehydrogenase (short-subunit alcohol dehydrogenase family)
MISADKTCLAWEEMSMSDLADKTTVITGAADGIGAAIAQAFAQAGARVFAGDVNEALGQELAARSEGKIVFVACDVAKSGDVKKLIATAVEQTGKLDVLVNNAGIAVGPVPIQEMTEADMQRQIAVNQMSMLYGFKHAVPHMLARKQGSIINLASMQAHVGIPGWTAYAGTKGAAIAMTHQLAVELAPFGIRVNAISPGAINTPMNAKIVREQGDDMLKIWNHMHPLGRIGEPSEIAAAALFLASDDASFITGVDLKVDGGVTLQTRNVLPPGAASAKEPK